MHYEDTQVELDAKFSLILLYTTAIDSAGVPTYNKFWAPKWPSLCTDCLAQPIKDKSCQSLIEFCDSDNVTRTKVYIYLVSCES